MQSDLPAITGVDAWRAAYQSMADQLPDLVRAAAPVLCLSNACIDVIGNLVDLERAIAIDGPPEAVELFETLKLRALEGYGGELRWQGKNVPDWLSALPGARRALGGTGPQAAWVLSEIGARPLTALADRSPDMLSVLPPRLEIAQKGRAVSGKSVTPRTDARPDIFIFEFSQGDLIAGQRLPRSSRFIVRFNDPGLERDQEFEDLSRRIASGAVALAGGLGSVGQDRIGAELAYLKGVADTWWSQGLALLHVELGGYADKAALAMVTDAVGDFATSLGMNASEFPDVTMGQSASPQSMKACAKRLGVRRLCVHADDWAASVTQMDAGTEHKALVCGSLLAAARADAGAPVMAAQLPLDSSFTDPPIASQKLSDGWIYVSVATPHLQFPAATIGLGDSFTSGCAIILGQRPPV